MILLYKWVIIYYSYNSQGSLYEPNNGKHNKEMIIGLFTGNTVVFVVIVLLFVISFVWRQIIRR